MKLLALFGSPLNCQEIFCHPSLYTFVLSVAHCLQIIHRSYGDRNLTIYRSGLLKTWNYKPKNKIAWPRCFTIFPLRKFLKSLRPS